MTVTTVTMGKYGDIEVYVAKGQNRTVYIPVDLMTDLRLAAIEQGSTLSDFDLAQEIRYVSYARKPLGNPPNEQDMRDYDNDRKNSCINCMGDLNKKDNKLYAATNTDQRGYYANTARLFFGLKSYPCPVCSSEGYRQRLIARCGVVQGERLSGGYFDCVLGRESYDALYNEVNSKILRNDLTGWYTLIGTPGTGKTSILELLTLQSVNHSIDAMYITQSDLDKQYQDSFSQSGYAAILSRIETVSVLCFDQIDHVRQVRADSVETMLCQQLKGSLDKRYKENKLTVFGTNYGFIEIAGGAYLDILYSRMKAGTMAECSINIREVLNVR